MDNGIQINLSDQTFRLFENKQLVRKYFISSAKNGPGEIENSECTPRGLHRIHSKIGRGAPLNSVFIARRWTGEIYSPQLHAKESGRDWILTRILRLEGLEQGRNQGCNLDTLQRYIYIHGTPDCVELGVPGSRGCIRMKNADLVEVFDMVDIHCLVNIIEL